MTEVRTLLRVYDIDSKKDLVYDTTTYTPVLEAPEGGWTYEDKLELEQAANDKELQFVRTHKGEVWRIALYQFNKKSITLNDPRTPAHGGRQRVKYEEIDSLGTCRHDGEDHADEEPEAASAVAQAPEHTDRAHALLSASSAHRWINCTPAPYLEAQHPDSDSEAAAEGTTAHELAEHKLRQALNEPTRRPESDWIDEDMEDHTDTYVDHVMAELHRTKQQSPGAFLAIEQRLDFSHIVPDGFGTSDATIVGDGTMTIVDFKYGKGVKVDAEDNPQMRLYALGALAQFGMIYDIHTVRMVIFQPRINNISTDEVPVEELTQWAEDVVRPAAALAIAGEGQLQAGTWCQFCRHAPQCTALAKQMFAPIPTTGDAFTPTAPDPDTLTDEQITQIVSVSTELKKWLGKVEAHALAQANNGHVYPGLKLVEGRSVRKYTDTDAVAAVVTSETAEDPYKPREVLGITAMTKLLGKKQFDELLGRYVHKPEGKPTLVPVSDKRPALEVATAETVFEPIGESA
ncbi:DUF2800 domain-containing protein [Corynebacterium sp. MSK041]|uniref:DUF2800 domain-containing protein n=1 Tax=Corynebacterium sp. MSK041 TaxID=3050194 RepID=UPI00254EA678|nr:DUF2800 domain-containing protein [Corynebacterium sp. MSK041]MDK8794210.1 DUF2800 domain-containing protein [Corynebacterium sp. MSK041]